MYFQYERWQPLVHTSDAYCLTQPTWPPQAPQKVWACSRLISLSSATKSLHNAPLGWYFTQLMLHLSGTFCSTWADGLWPRWLALWWWSLCFRYSVRALGLWQYGWYVVTRAWEISQAYEVFRGSVGSAQQRLDWHKNSDLRSEVGFDTGLNSTTHRLIESVALLTKSIGIVTPLILSMVVVVALR